MLTLANPANAYRRVQRDAAILGSDGQALTLLCYDEFIAALGSTLHADRHGLANARRTALTRAASALSAIRAGTDAAHPMAAVLNSMFDAAERSVRASMVRFQPETVAAIRADYADIRAALGNIPR